MPVKTKAKMYDLNVSNIIPTTGGPIEVAIP